MSRLMRNRLLDRILVVLATIMLSSISYAQIGGTAGVFSRMGFGARGMGMGNAQTAVTTGDLVGYYNPASLPFAKRRTISASFGLLTLDRSLNFISYTQPLPRAGISAGIINSGVTDIDGRDSDGEQTGPLLTSENQVFLAFSIQPSQKIALGVNVKYYHNHLYSDVIATKISLDLGLLVVVGPNLSLGATARDLNSQYDWNTSNIYGNLGGQLTDKFPRLYTFGAAYKLQDSLMLIAVDIEASDRKTLIARAGVEIPLVPAITLRAGIDRIDLKEKGNGVKPTFGFTARKSIGDWIPAVNYAFMLEPFTSSGIHVISLSAVF